MGLEQRWGKFAGQEEIYATLKKASPFNLGENLKDYWGELQEEQQKKLKQFVMGGLKLIHINANTKLGLSLEFRDVTIASENAVQGLVRVYASPRWTYDTIREALKKHYGLEVSSFTSPDLYFWSISF
jgi:hypothetical protein